MQPWHISSYVIEIISSFHNCRVRDFWGHSNNLSTQRDSHDKEKQDFLKYIKMNQCRDALAYLIMT